MSFSPAFDRPLPRIEASLRWRSNKERLFRSTAIRSAVISESTSFLRMSGAFPRANLSHSSVAQLFGRSFLQLRQKERKRRHENIAAEHPALRSSGPPATGQTRSEYDEKTQKTGGSNRLDR